ncbi:hypothetical protein [Streptomyces sp. NPDC008125]|uniref:phthiocerol/phthiodiolone dimycocerosyl transferase family protein n=1 Tax=Streptomyces sp. NPDC008125 TaxID=3364811 RepID=UPI0036E9BC0E
MTRTTAAHTRVLAPSESVSSPARNTIRMAVHCSGPLAPDILRRAWKLVGHEDPGLAGTLRHLDGAYVFEPSQDRAGLVKQVEEIPDGERLTAHLTLDELDCVAALEICTVGEDSHIVSLLMRHSLADGKHGLHVLDRLWKLYTELTEGSEPTVLEPIVSGSLEASLGGRRIPKGTRREPEPGAPAVYRSAPDWDGTRLSGLEHGRVRLTTGETEQLVRSCKERSMSLHGVVSAAVLLSLSRSRTDLHRFDLTSVINVRPHMDPPLHPIEGTYILGYSVSTVDVTLYSDVDSIAKAVVDNLRADLQSGAAQTSSVDNAGLQNAGAVPTMLSNLGVVPEFSHPENIVFTDFSAWNEMDLARPGSPDVLAAYGNMLVASTFAGRLGIDLFHGREMFPDGWSAAQVRQITEILTSYAS